MLRHMVFFSAWVLWIASMLDDSLGSMIYIVWGMAFLFSIYGYSLLFALLSLAMSVSYLFIDTHSESLFLATLLPWIFGIFATIFLLMVGVRYLSYREVEYVHDYSEVHKKKNLNKYKIWFGF